MSVASAIEIMSGFSVGPDVRYRQTTARGGGRAGIHETDEIAARSEGHAAHDQVLERAQKNNLSPSRDRVP